MIFSSLVFLCIFLPIVFLLYSIIPSLKVRNGLLIVASLAFYAYGEPVYVLLMIFSSLLNYLCALLVNNGSDKKRRIALICCVAVNLGILCLFKYTGFLVSSVNGLLGLSIPVPQITLPIGISFFTFQALSYVIDVYWKRVDVQKNYFHVLLYIAFFPQLIAGPIVKYRDINEAISNRSQDAQKVAQGLRRFICGLGKKVLIANAMGRAADAVFAADANSLGMAGAWIGAIAYLFQIYYDFSGYSDMAIGLGHMFGFEFKENFQYPYGAVSVQDFWRRWHISLSTWFKEYLYIPLGGNRKGKARTALNRIIVFFFTGLWHGASWTFVLWGLYHGLFLLFEEYIPVVKKLPGWLSRIYTLLVVCIGFVMFRADTVGQGFAVIGKMFSGSAQGMSLAVQQLTPWFLVMLAAAIIGAAPIRPLADRIRKSTQSLSGCNWGAAYANFIETSGMAAQKSALCKKRNAVEILLYIGAFLLLVWCMLRLSGSTYNPFIYFRF